ncbi:MAG TPA: serine/threonine-protein kinase, partial [Planctomycetaceae bacterium]|nr:serine/threonine-protein kinase [Planctomycetaceae bacterium]
MDLETRYELLEKVGAGSFATVYRARDLELGREVAIKQIHQQYLDDPKQLERYWQEAQLLASLGHPNIVTIFDIHRDRGWLILELMQASLAERMAGRQMDLRALRATLAHGLRALQYLHGRGILHGDIKLSNLMIDHRRRVKIGDFGLARRASDDEGSLLKGTTKYMAPEVVSDEFGEIGPPSDLYSLGFCAYELLCGPNFESLFPGLNAFGRNKQVAWMMWHAAADRRLPEIHRVLEGVPDDLARVVQKLTEKDQSKRYRSADEALSDLKVDVKIVRSSPGGDPDVVDDAAPDEAARRKRLRIAAIGFGVSLLVCLALLFLPGGGGTGAEGPQTHVRIVTEVYPDANEIKVEDLDGQFAQKLSLGETPRILLVNTGRNITLDELEPGDRVELEQATDERGRPVWKVRAARPVPNRGRIRSINRQTREVTLAIADGEARGEQTMRVPERAAITLNGHPSDLRLLEEGDPVEVTHLSEVGERPGRVVARLDVHRLATGMGFVTDVDVERRRLTVNVGASTLVSAIHLPVADDCRITLDGESIGLVGLQPQDLVRFRYDIEFQHIDAERTARLSGLVREVRGGRRELVISTQTGDEKTLSVPASADVTLNLTPADFDDLRRNDTVDVTLSTAGGAAASAVLARRVPIHNRWAVVVGIDGYEDKNLTPLQYAVDDAKLVKDSLLNRYACAPERLVELIDSTREELQAGIDQVLSGAGRETQVIVYLACHAYAGDDGRVYLAGRRFRIDQTAETGLPLEWVVERLEACPARDKLLLLDCSHTGTGSDLTRQPSTAEMLQTLKAPLRSTVAIASCAPGERGLVWPEKRHGRFAWFVAQAFNGKADADRDLHLTAAELFRYLETSMAAVSPG